MAHSRRVFPVLAVSLLAATSLSGCFGWWDDLTSPVSQPGQWAKDFLSADKYDSLLVEIDYVQGFAPSSAALALLEQRIGERLNKPGGVTVRLDDVLPATGDEYSIRDVARLEERHRDERRGDGRAVFYVLYLDGSSDLDQGDSKVLGAAYAGSSVVMFQRTIREAAEGLPLTTTPASSIERAVLVHELGHILGLVNNGLPMVRHHEDASHPSHSRNEDSVMFWAVERSNVVNLLQGRTEPPNNFDADDIADMRAAGGK